MTDVVILAAGLGRRLRSVSTLPKWLTPINGACPADMQLAGLAESGAGRCYVVVNPDAAEIDRYLDAWREQVSIETVVNPHAHDRNNWYSLLVGLEAAGTASDVLVVNSDLFGDRTWFSTLASALPTAPAAAALAIDPDKGAGEEEMKVAIDPSGRMVTAIGKVGIDRPGGEYVGMAWLSDSGVSGLCAVLKGFIGDSSRIDHWYEHGMQEHMNADGRYAAVPVPSGAWVEIDGPGDLEIAQRLAAAGGLHDIG